VAQRLTAAQALRYPWVLGVEYTAPSCLLRIRRAAQTAPTPEPLSVAVPGKTGGGITPSATLVEGKKQTANKSRKKNNGV